MMDDQDVYEQSNQEHNLAGPVNADEGTNKTYQDDLDTGDEDVDPVINETTEDPTELLQVPPDEFKDELDQIAIDDIGRGRDDMREMIEDRDEDDDNAASNA